MNRSILLPTIALLGMCGSASGNLIANGSFEATSHGKFGAGSDIGGWLLEFGGGTVFWDHPYAADGSQVFYGGTISQVVTLKPRRHYELRLSAATIHDSPATSVSVTAYPEGQASYVIGGAGVGGRPGTPHGWQDSIFTFRAQSDREKLAFSSNGYLDRISLTELPPLLAGDYNLDDIVDAADYVVWRRGVGTLVPPCDGGDANCNGFVEWAEHEPWRDNYGRTLGEAEPASVPEPFTSIVFAAGLCLLSMTTRFRVSDNP